MLLEPKEQKTYRNFLELGRDDPIPEELLEAHNEIKRACNAWNAPLRREMQIMIVFLYNRGLFAPKPPVAEREKPKTQRVSRLPKRRPGRPKKKELEPVG
jgi:hypothetical protein